MKETPILFSTAMVQAIIAGNKTQTRRIAKPQPIIDVKSGYVLDGKGIRSPFDIHNWKEPYTDYFCKYNVGDLLWVRETWADVTSAFTDTNKLENIAFKSDNTVWICYDKLHYLELLGDSGIYVKKWKPSIYMPKDAARIWLRITDIRVERLQDISEQSAAAEGIEIVNNGTKYKCYRKKSNHMYESAVTSFYSLWESINGKDSWDANPWVWVVSFDVISTTGKPKEEIILPEYEETYDGDENDFQPCAECIQPDACEDFSCAIKSGLQKTFMP